MLNPARLTSPSGGLWYHITALRQKKAWTPFTEELHQWLLNWPIRNRSLCLIGPSGGYSLKQSFLSRFDQVVCIDPDPLAPYIFRKRFPKVKTTWDNNDYFDFKGELGLKTSKVSALKSKYSNHDFLFSNLLGQISQISGQTAVHSKCEQLLVTLSGISWASYHDLYSFSLKQGTMTLQPNIAKTHHQISHDKSEQGLLDFPHNHLATPAIQGILKSLYPQRTPLHLSIKDHLTHDLFGVAHSSYIIPWQIRPNYLHLIEAINQEDFLVPSYRSINSPLSKDRGHHPSAKINKVIANL